MTFFFYESAQLYILIIDAQNMYQNCTSMQVLLSKAEALIDRYLDTTTPPWVKVSLSLSLSLSHYLASCYVCLLLPQVTVPPELAAQVVAAAMDLSQVKVRNYVYRLNDLLSRCQRLVFLDMVPYWSAFCLQYVSPDGSTLYLPTGKIKIKWCLLSQLSNSLLSKCCCDLLGE